MPRENNLNDVKINTEKSTYIKVKLFKQINIKTTKVKCGVNVALYRENLLTIRIINVSNFMFSSTECSMFLSFKILITLI